MKSKNLKLDFNKDINNNSINEVFEFIEKCNNDFNDFINEYNNNKDSTKDLKIDYDSKRLMI